MLTIGPCQYDRPDDPAWWVTANGVLVGAMSGHPGGGYLVTLNLHYAKHDRWVKRFPGKAPTQHQLAEFDTDRLRRWARANEGRLLKECPAPAPHPAPLDISPERFDLTPPSPRQAKAAQRV